MKNLIAASGVAGILILGGCTSAQLEASEAQIEDVITSATAITCGIIPTAASILAVAGAVTGTSVITGLASTAITAIEKDICSATPPATSARFKAIPQRGIFTPPGIVGTTKHNVVVTGYRP